MIERIVGIDCATDPKKVGLALVERVGSHFRLASTACSLGNPAREIAEWVRQPGRTLLTLDAPLGWPSPMGEALAAHEAGQPLPELANQLFRRDTDRMMYARFKKTSLDVGADRIARTAHWALSLLADLRSSLGELIPLAWSPKFEERVAAIEVYPAATIMSRGISIKGYKAEAGHVERSAVYKEIQRSITCDSAGDPANWPIDALDAAVCGLAGLDFVEGRAVAPEDMGLARKEGWIWV